MLPAVHPLSMGPKRSLPDQFSVPVDLPHAMEGNPPPFSGLVKDLENATSAFWEDDALKAYSLNQVLLPVGVRLVRLAEPSQVAGFRP